MYDRDIPMKHRITAKLGLASAALLALATIAACAQKEARPAFRGAVLIGDRGISVPLPPPSLLGAPEQAVEIEVQINGAELSAGAELRVVDVEGDYETSITLDGETPSVMLEDVPLDLTMNCLELWLIDEDEQGEHVLYQAMIAADDQSVETQSGCD